MSGAAEAMGGSWGFNIRGEGTPDLELDMYDVIGSPWTGANSRDVRRALKSSASAKSITCRINSGGGDVIEGNAIYNLLCEHPAKVTVQIDGVAASMASVIAMAGDTRRIAANAYVMIHNPKADIQGTAEELRQRATLLDSVKEQMAKTYADRSGMPIADVRKAMDAETWYTAEEAKKAGLVDEIVPAKKVSASASIRLFARAPKEALAMIDCGESHEPTGPASAQKEDRKMHGLLVLLGLAATASEADAMSAVNTLRGSLQAIEGLTGKSGSEALGTIQGWKETAAKVPELEAKLASFAAKAIETEVDGLLRDAATQNAKGFVKISPAEKDSLRVAGMKDPAWLKGYLATKTDVIKLGATASPPAVTDVATGNAGTDGVNALGGRKYEDFEPYELHNIRAENPDAFAALKANWKERGAPRKPLSRA